MNTHFPTRRSSDLIKHALMILIHNAIDSMAGMDEKYLMLDAATYAECVVLILADNGPMIPVEDRSKFFDPFFSTKERGIGLGFMKIGRASCRESVCPYV